MDGNVKDTPPTVFVPEHGRPPPLGRPGRPSWPGPSRSSRPASRPPGPSSTSGSPPSTPETLRRDGPRRGPEAPGLARRPRLDRQEDDGRRDRAGRRRRLREGSGVLLRLWVKPSQGEPRRGAPRPDGRRGRLPRLGPLARRRQGRRAHHPQVAGRRPQGRLRRRRSSPTVEPRPGHLRRLGQGRRASRSTSTASSGPNQVDADALKGTIRTKVPLKLGQRNNALEGRGRHLSTTSGSTPGPSRADEVDRLVDAGQARLPRREAGRQAARARGRRRLRAGSSRPRTRPRRSWPRSWRRSRSEQAAIKARGTIAHVMNEKAEPAMAYILFRGDYDKRRDPVKADTPDALPPMPSDLPRNRLGLAQWLVRPEHPLTARVTVNRFWQEIFGTGLVKTAGDFGLSGELPSHPELLDWLAVEFRDSGLGRQGVLQAAGDLGRLPPVGRDHARGGREGPAEPLPRPRASLPDGRRDGPRLRPGRQRPARPQDRRAERPALPARRGLGGRGHARQRHPRLPPGHGREALSPEPLHLLEAVRPAGLDGHLQRPEPRGLHRPPRADQHPAPGPRHPQRHPVRRGRPAPGRGRS